MLWEGLKVLEGEPLSKIENTGVEMREDTQSIQQESNKGSQKNEMIKLANTIISFRQIQIYKNSLRPEMFKGMNNFLRGDNPIQNITT